MRGRAWTSLLLMIAFIVFSCITFYGSQHDIHRNLTEEEIQRVEVATIERLDVAGLYRAFKAGTLPTIYVESYITNIENSVKAEYMLDDDQLTIGQTDPLWVWMVFAGVAAICFVLWVIFLIGNAKWYMRWCAHWEAKTELKKALTREQIKTLNEIVRIQNKILES